MKKYGKQVIPVLAMIVLVAVFVQSDTIARVSNSTAQTSLDQLGKGRTVAAGNVKKAVAAEGKEKTKESVSQSKPVNQTGEQSVSTPKQDVLTGKAADAQRSGARTMASDKNQVSSDLEEYTGTVTDVESVNELESEHPYANNEDHLWVYKNENAPALAITFNENTSLDADTDDYIYIYDADDTLLACYCGNGLAGEKIIVWGDTVKIRLITDGENVTEDSNECYGFKVDSITIPEGESTYEYTYEELPSLLYTGDTKNIALVLNKKYIENGELIVEPVENAVFKWEEYSNSSYEDGDSSKAANITINGSALQIAVASRGYVYGAVQAYIGDDTACVLSKMISFNTESEIVNRCSFDCSDLCVNEIRSSNLDFNVQYRGEEKQAKVTQVTSSNGSIIKASLEESDEEPYIYLVGITPGDVEVTITYTIQVEDNEIELSTVAKLTCKEDCYSCFINTSSDINHVLRTSVFTVAVETDRFYYDKDNEQNSESVTGCTLQLEPQENASDYVDVQAADGLNISCTAKAVGTAIYTVHVMKDGKEVASTQMQITVCDECYGMEYNGPTKLYPGQIVEGPKLYRYYLKDGAVQKEQIQDVTIASNDSEIITANADGTITAVAKSAYGTITFSCYYDNGNEDSDDDYYYVEKEYCINNPEIQVLESIYINESSEVQLESGYTFQEGSSIEWSVVDLNDQGDESKEPATYASITTKDERTAIVTGLKEGNINIIVKCVKGENILWSNTYQVDVVAPYSGVRLDKTREFNVNETDYLWFCDYRINRKYYTTIITDVTSSDNSIVQIVNTSEYNEYNEDGHREYKIICTAKKAGNATITVKYRYVDENGKFISKEATCKVTVTEASYRGGFHYDTCSTIPGGSVQLTAEVYKVSYDTNGNCHEDVLQDMEIRCYVKDPSIATVDNTGLVTIKDAAKVGDQTDVYFEAYENGVKVLTSGTILVSVISDYYSIKGIDSDIITLEEGESKTIAPTLLHYDLDHKEGVKVEDAKFTWRSMIYDDEGDRYDYASSLENETITASGMTITGKQAGERELVLAASYVDGEGKTQYQIRDIEIKVLQKQETSLELGKTITITDRNHYSKLTPVKTSTYAFRCTNDYGNLMLRIYDSAWNTLYETYSWREDIGDDFLVYYPLDANQTYYIYTYYDEYNDTMKPYTLTVSEETPPININTCKITLSQQQAYYTGESFEPELTIQCGKNTLEEGIDYTVELNEKDSDAIDVGTYTYSIRGIGKYTGEVYKDFYIKACPLSDDMLQSMITSYQYNEEKHQPTITLESNGETLKDGRDYCVEYQGDFTTMGSNVITIYGKGNYTGTLTKTVHIFKDCDITSTLVQLSKTSTSYNGKVQKPTVVVKKDDTILNPGTDYTLTYAAGFINAGTYSIVVKGTGSFHGTVSKTFTINKATPTFKYSKTTVQKSYGNKAFSNPLTQTGKGTITYKTSNAKVATVSTKGVVTIKGIGSATITVSSTGDANYKGTKTSYVVKVVKGKNIITASNITKTTSNKAMTVALSTKTSFKTTLSYKSNNKNVKVSKGKLVIAKNFVGKATITITGKSTTNYTTVTKKITVTVNPTATTLSSVKKKATTKATVSWKKNSKITGYQIQYSTSSKFTSPTTKTVGKVSTVTYSLSGLERGKTYYVRIRTYKTVNKVRYYSGWSTVKKVKM